jgi:hypothetical protein
MSWCRHIIGIEPEPMLFRTDGRRQLRVLWVTAKVYFFALGPFGLGYFLSTSTEWINSGSSSANFFSALSTIYLICTFVFSLVVLARLAVAVPMASLDEAVRLRSLFRERKGHGWPFFTAGLIALGFTLPLIFVLVAVRTAVLAANPDWHLILALEFSDLILTGLLQLFNVSVGVQAYLAWKGALENPVKGGVARLD